MKLFSPPILVAEIGCNHKGEFEIAKEMLHTAKDFCKVKWVKFQKRHPKEVLSAEEYHSPHPNPEHSYGKTYGEHRERLEFSLSQHQELKLLCEQLGLIYGCSVWDLKSTSEIASLRPHFIKIPSALNTHFKLLSHLLEIYSGEIHLSLGMTTRLEEQNILNFFESRKRLQDLVIYACTSAYPVAPEHICLLEISRLVEQYGRLVKSIGFSGHHNGISLDIAAYTLGATFIERHYTLDRTWKGTDHAASLEPDGLRRVQRDLTHLHKALQAKPKDLLEIEIPSRSKLKWDRHQETPILRHSEQIKILLMDVDGVLTDSGMYYTENGDELKKFNTRDGQGIAMLHRAGIKTAIFTKENTQMVTRRAAKLGIQYVFQGVQNKLLAVKTFLHELSIDPNEVCYIGDDTNDLEVLSFIGFPAVPGDAVSDCKKIAQYVTHSLGGEGCVREIAEVILKKNTQKLRAQHTKNISL